MLRCWDCETAGSGPSHSLLGCPIVLLHFWASLNSLQLSLIFCKLLHLLCWAFLVRKYLCTSPNASANKPRPWYMVSKKVLIYWSVWLFFRNLWRKCVGLDFWSDKCAIEKTFLKVLSTENSSDSKLSVKHVLSCIRGPFSLFPPPAILFAIPSSALSSSQPFLSLSVFYSYSVCILLSLPLSPALTLLFLFFLWNSIPLVSASPLPFILLSHSLMGGFLLFGLCGLPCTFQLFSFQDPTCSTQWGDYL